MFSNKPKKPIKQPRKPKKPNPVSAKKGLPNKLPTGPERGVSLSNRMKKKRKPVQAPKAPANEISQSPPSGMSPGYNPNEQTQMMKTGGMASKGYRNGGVVKSKGAKRGGKRGKRRGVGAAIKGFGKVI